MAAQRSQKRAIDALELEIKEVVRLVTWVLATKLKSSACEPSFQLLTHLSNPQIPFILVGVHFILLCICMCTPLSVSLLFCETEYGCVTHSPSLLSAFQKLDRSHVPPCSVDCLSLKFWRQGVVIQFSGLMC